MSNYKFHIDTAADQIIQLAVEEIENKKDQLPQDIDLVKLLIPEEEEIIPRAVMLSNGDKEVFIELEEIDSNLVIGTNIEDFIAAWQKQLDEWGVDEDLLNWMDFYLPPATVLGFEMAEAARKIGDLLRAKGISISSDCDYVYGDYENDWSSADSEDLEQIRESLRDNEELIQPLIQTCFKDENRQEIWLERLAVEPEEDDDDEDFEDEEGDYDEEE